MALVPHPNPGPLAVARNLAPSLGNLIGASLRNPFAWAAPAWYTYQNFKEGWKHFNQFGRDARYAWEQVEPWIKSPQKSKNNPPVLAKRSTPSTPTATSYKKRPYSITVTRRRYRRRLSRRNASKKTRKNYLRKYFNQETSKLCGLADQRINRRAYGSKRLRRSQLH